MMSVNRSEVESFIHAGEVIERGSPRFQDVITARSGEPFHPFSGTSEFELVKYLNSIPFAKVDSFFQLDWVRTIGGTSFTSGAEMREHIKHLAQPGMSWKIVDIHPRSGTAISPVYLCYRDPVEAIRTLSDRPSLAQHMSYIPERRWADKAGEVRQYSEIFTGDWAWRTQESLPASSTLVPVLLCSDHAQAIDRSGERMVLPVYLSVGNIHSSVRNMPSADCWMLIAYIPITRFTEQRELHSALQARLFHQCLKVVLASLKMVAENGEEFVDSIGDSRRCYTRIAAYLADYPGQILVNAAPASHSPVTTAGLQDLVNATPHPRRTRQWILEQISCLRCQIDPEDTLAYRNAARDLGLSAVDQPFWEDFPGYEPDLGVCPDISYGLLRLWRDYILGWVRHLVGKTELDQRIKTLQPLPEARHYATGISELLETEWSTQDDKELQKVLLAVISGAPRIDQTVMRCLRAFHDFLYLAQYRIHTSLSLRRLEQSLNVFHSLKDTFITNSAQQLPKGRLSRHFHLPSICALHTYSYHIAQMGSPVQFSMELIASCRQPVEKALSRTMHNRAFFVQICAHLDRNATILLAKELALWSFLQDGLQQPLQWPSESVAFVRRMMAEATAVVKPEVGELPIPTKHGRVLLNSKPNGQELAINNVLRSYRLRSQAFHIAFSSFVAEQPVPKGMITDLTTMKVDTWYQCCVQLFLDDGAMYGDSRAIKAIPPTSAETPFGHCTCALIRRDEDTGVTGIAGHHVVQVRLIFQLVVPSVHPFHRLPLAYVYNLSDPPTNTESDINMYKVHYPRGPDGHRVGRIVRLANLYQPVQLIPEYGPNVHPGLSAANSMDAWNSYLINLFMDLDAYQTVW